MSVVWPGNAVETKATVHRDVKPSNMMLDEAGRIRILDFGLAQLSVWDEASVDLTTVGQLMGTLDYMAPEQAELSGGVDYRADLYAMGATLFRLLCGRPPLAAAPNQSPLEKLRMLANHQPPKLDTLCPEAPAALVALVGSMLARSPQDRPASAAHVAEQLAEFAESADLVSLLKRAKVKEALSPEPIASERNHRDFVPAMARVPVAVADSIGRRSIRRWIIAAIGFPLLLIAGVFIKLEMEKGQLVIESEVANVKVQIIHDGKPVSALSINQGTTATRLRADKYEIVIDGPSDGLTIDNNQFTLQNGATVVARIRVDAPDESPTKPIVSSTVPAKGVNPDNEPLYEGKTLSEWLEMLARERSTTGLKSAFDACRALVSPDNSERITQAVLSVVPGLDGKRNLTPGQDVEPTTLDNEAFSILRKANSGPAYYALWVSQFDHADEKWHARLWQYGLSNGDQQTANTLKPFLAWAERRLSRTPTGDKSADDDTFKAADHLRRFSAPYPYSVNDATFVERVCKALKNSPILQSTWWLSQPLVHRSYDGDGTKDTILWSPVIASEITHVAVEALEKSDTPVTLVAQACSILANGAELNQEQRTSVLNSLANRLTSLSTTPDTLTELVPIAEAFSGFSVPQILPNDAFSSVRVQIVAQHRSSESSLVLEMLTLVGKLDGVASVQPQLDLVLEETHDTLELINSRHVKWEEAKRSPGAFGRSSPFIVDLAWPELTGSDGGMSRNSTGLAGGPGKVPLATLQLWGTYEPTADDWLKYLILLHPTMKETVDAALAKIDSP